MIRLIVCFLLVSVHISITAASQKTIYLASADVRQKTLSYSQAFTKLADKVDSRFYSVDGLIDALDYDVEAAVDFVETEIAYDPYLGVMRGPDGTISTESGSTWDQAVLLAALINAMGGEAMLALGKLPKNEAIALLARGVVSRQSPSNRLENLDVEAFLEKELGIKAGAVNTAQFQQNNGVSYEEYSKVADNIASRLIAQLKVEGLPLSNSSSSSAIDYAGQLGNEYVWVRYRDTPNNPWTDVHPVYDGETPPDVKPEKYISAKVPQEKLHKIAIQFHIETKIGDTYKRIPISQAYEKPAANLAAIQLRIGISPNTVGLQDEPSYYTPIIGDTIAPGAKAFTIMGQTVSPEDAAAGPAIFATVANKLGGAIEGVADNDKNVPKLTGVILTISHVAPDGERFDEERRLTDFREGRPENYHLELISRAVIEVDVGPENGVRNYRNFLNAASISTRQLPYYQAVMSNDLKLEDMYSHPAFAKSPEHSWLQHLSLDGFMAPITSAGRVIRTSPLVMIKRDILSTNRAVKFAVDIQHNRVRGFSIDSKNQAIENPAIALRHGVMETLLEGEFIGLSSIADWKTESNMRLISSEEKLKADPIWNASPRTTQDRMIADLKYAGSILIPNNQQDNWWRIDINSGTLLGMGTLGGSESTQYAVLMEGVAMTVTLGLFTYGMISGGQACMNSGKSQSYRNCCLLGVTLLNVGLVAAGGAYGSAFGAAWKPLTGLIHSISFDVLTGAPQSPVANLLGQPQEFICNWVGSK